MLPVMLAGDWLPGAPPEVEEAGTSALDGRTAFAMSEDSLFAAADSSWGGPDAFEDTLDMGELITTTFCLHAWLHGLSVTDSAFALL